MQGTFSGQNEEVPLIAEGADKSVEDAGSMAIKLHAAASSGEIEEVSRLIADGADVSASVSVAGEVEQFFMTPLHAAALGGNAEVVKALLDAGASVVVEENTDGTALRWNHTPLHFACLSGNEEVAKILVDSGMSVRCSNRIDGFTALHYVKPRTPNPEP